ncbi:MAG: sulfotransferase [Candidatus Hodarchaeota archaeon]
MEKTQQDRSHFQLDFIGIGAPRTGSTWLTENLAVHPDIFIPKKELHYFNRTMLLKNNRNFNKPLEWYAAFFKTAKSHQIKGESTPRYFFDKHSAERIYRFNPDIKLLVVLRHPIERLLTLHLNLIRKGVIHRIPFENILKISAPQPLLTETLYFRALKRYFDLFPRENIKITFYEDLIKDGSSFLRDIQDFLGVNHFIPRTLTKRVNVTLNPSFLPINMLLYHIQLFFYKCNLTAEAWPVKYLASVITKPYWHFYRKTGKPYDQKPQINERFRKALINYYLRDLEQLERFLGKDLSHWKT